jgi:hypothetical protein
MEAGGRARICGGSHPVLSTSDRERDFGGFEISNLRFEKQENFRFEI